jgi:hypothetical protein
LRRILASDQGLTFRAASGTVRSVMKKMVRPDWFYAYYFTPPVLSAGEVVLA